MTTSDMTPSEAAREKARERFAVMGREHGHMHIDPLCPRCETEFAAALDEHAAQATERAAQIVEEYLAPPACPPGICARCDHARELAAAIRATLTGGSK